MCRALAGEILAVARYIQVATGGEVTQKWSEEPQTSLHYRLKSVCNSCAASGLEQHVDLYR
ncbi:MAG: hypothetical protein ACI9G1_004797 [Pirellulaceae bacterium]|jgi:hypothetical protein